MAYTRKTTLPPCNRLLEKKFEDKRLQAHATKLRDIKSSIDTTAPRDFRHIKQNVRKHQIEEDRMSTIERHNYQLMYRMNKIMHTTGRVDHRNLDWKPKRSLNFVKKQEETDRLLKENRDMLKRIQVSKPQYSVESWENEFRHHRSLSKSISLLPPVKTQPRRSRTLPVAMNVGHDSITLPPINRSRSNDRPETDQSDIQEEIDVELPATELKAVIT